jgi:ABC-type xylose transport system permease subunit
MEGKIEKKSGIRTNAILLALVSVMVLFEILIRAEGKGSLFAPANISNLINQNAYVVILAVGMLLCILTGGNIDLSVGSIVCLVGAVAGTLIVNMGMNIYLAIIICLLFGILLGAWQGYWIAYVRIPPFIVTLAGMLLFRGLANVILNGLTISPFPENYLRLFTSYIPESDNDTLQMTVSLSVAGGDLHPVRDQRDRQPQGQDPQGLCHGKFRGDDHQDGVDLRVRHGVRHVARPAQRPSHRAGLAGRDHLRLWLLHQQDGSRPVFLRHGRQ